MKIKVLVIDDSALVRTLLTEIINANEDMEVVATAADALIARDLIKLHNPDVLTLDIEMPKMDGLVFLERLMRLRPMPVIVISSLTVPGSETALRALKLGAVDFVTKPKLNSGSGLIEGADVIVSKIRMAVKVEMRIPFVDISSGVNFHNINVLPTPICVSAEKLIVIGASTGGVVAISTFLMEMTADCPGILITQHMPAGFTLSFARRLDTLCRVTVKEADDGEVVLPGHAYIAPGGKHMRVTKKEGSFYIQIDDSAPVNRHKPSVDVLFNSVAKYAGKQATGIIMTGMGRDGALGMLNMKHAGAYNFAQDEESCAVYGMPKEAVALGAVDVIANLNSLADLVRNQLLCGN